MKATRNRYVRVTPDPGADRYLIEIAATVDGLALHSAPNKKKFIEQIVCEMMFAGLEEEMIGMLAMARLTPKDRRQVLTRQFIEQAEKERRLVSTKELNDYLRESGVEP